MMGKGRTKSVTGLGLSQRSVTGNNVTSGKKPSQMQRRMPEIDNAVLDVAIRQSDNRINKANSKTSKLPHLMARGKQAKSNHLAGNGNRPGPNKSRASAVVGS